MDYFSAYCQVCLILKGRSDWSELEVTHVKKHNYFTYLLSLLIRLLSTTSLTQAEVHPALKNRELQDLEVAWKDFLKHLEY